MYYSTTDAYQLKREIVSFCRKLSANLDRPSQKFTSDVIYGLLASESTLLSDIADALKEPIRKKNTIDRLARHLSSGPSSGLSHSFWQLLRPFLPQEPVVLVDDTDIVKPYGKAFESLGMVRDASDPDGSFQKGYHCTEMVLLSNSDSQPISLFSHIHSSAEKNFRSVNSITRSAISLLAQNLGRRAVFVFDRGYDANDLFLHMDHLQQDYVVRLTAKRKLFVKGKWVSAPALCSARKGKFKTTVLFQGEQKECWLSHLNVQITASKKTVRLVLVYGLGEHPMMLCTNRPIRSKEDVVGILRLYLSRWRIEEYFRFKKQTFDFENMRVRSLAAMNALNQMLSYAIFFLASLHKKRPSSRLKCRVYEFAGALKKQVLFYYYRLAKGTAAILAHAKTGIRSWWKPPRPNPRQLSMCLRY